MMVRWLMGLCLVAPVLAQDELTVVPGDYAPAPAEMVHQKLLDQVDEALAARKANLEETQSAEAIQAYQQRLREFFIDQIGGLPPDAPLNAEIVGGETREADGYRYEKVIFESQPGHHVTALMFLPLTPPPYPAVLIPCGHSANGKGSEFYQSGSILLAQHGIAALLYDPIGQGERYQILDENNEPRFNSTIEHIHDGIGSILVGRNTATYRIWDGMRAIDYLVSRDDIDGERIGCAGNSGGGTMTSYLMALDDRIQAASPSCYITSFEKHLHLQGPHDAEQNIFGGVKEGMNHADYIIMRAPKPTLICCATNDFFDIHGTWDSFRQAKRVYGHLGFAERVDIIETYNQHGWHPPLREGMARFMLRWLKEERNPVTEKDVTLLTEPEYTCTEPGQVLLLDGEKSVFDLNAAYETELAAKRDAAWAEMPRDKQVAAIRRIAGIRPAAELPEPAYENRETIQREGYTVEKGILTTDDGIYLPVLTFRPVAETAKIVLYLNGAGKAADAAPGGPMEALAHSGHIVVAPDLRGFGETASTSQIEGNYVEWFGADWQHFYLAYLLGQTYVGLRAEDIQQCARALKAITGVEPTEVHVQAIGDAGIPTLHAAAIADTPYTTVKVTGVTDWVDIVRTDVTKDQLINTVHGALEVYDLAKLRTMAQAN